MVFIGEIGWLDELNVERTEQVLWKISEMVNEWINSGHVDKETIYGIEVLNEPWGKFILFYFTYTLTGERGTNRIYTENCYFI